MLVQAASNCRISSFIVAVKLEHRTTLLLHFQVLHFQERLEAVLKIIQGGTLGR